MLRGNEAALIHSSNQFEHGFGYSRPDFSVRLSLHFVSGNTSGPLPVFFTNTASSFAGFVLLALRETP